MLSVSKFTTALLIFGLAGFFAVSVKADTAADIKSLENQISNREAEIKKLDEEIARYRLQLTTTQTERVTLQKELDRIEATRNKLSTELKKTQEKLSQTNLSLRKISLEISSTTAGLSANRLALAESLRSLREADNISLLELLLTKKNTSDIAQAISNLTQLEDKVLQKVNDRYALKRELENKETLTAQEKKKLDSLGKQLNDQKVLADQAKQEQDTLITVTKNKEQSYQSLLADRMKRKNEVEAEIRQIEESIKVAIDPSSLPATGKGVLAWPVNPPIRITQYFGHTEFATQNAQVYNGRGHNGIDLGLSQGSPILASAEGKVIGAGDTDTACRGASYGKWVLIEHPNGLTTLYAHLSLIKVVEGQSLRRSELIGYSGNTGYSTGPHLHFTVYASAGVKVGSLQSKVPGCGVYRLPLASYNSYLNPLSYLP